MPIRTIHRSISESAVSLAPLLDVALHRDVLGLPVVRLHRPVELVGPAVLQRQQIEVIVSRPPTTRFAARAASAFARSRTKVLGRSCRSAAPLPLLRSTEEEPPVGPDAAHGRPSSEDIPTTRRQATGLGPQVGALPLRDSAGIAPDFADILDTPRSRGKHTIRGQPDGAHSGRRPARPRLHTLAPMSQPTPLERRVHP